MNVLRLFRVRRGAIALVIGLALVAGSMTATLASASASAPKSDLTSARCPYTFAVITHGDNGSFWSVVYKGAKDAAKDLGCTLSEVYGSQQQGQAEPDDVAENAQIQDAINAHVNGIAVSDHDPTLMNPTIAKAVARGIPVVLLNAGCDPADLAASRGMTCVGQPETLAGQTAGATVQEPGQDQRPVRDPPVRPEPPRPLQRPGDGPRPFLMFNEEPTCQRRCLHRADPEHSQCCLQPHPGDRAGHAYLQAHPGSTPSCALNSAIGDALVAAAPAKVKIAHLRP